MVLVIDGVIVLVGVMVCVGVSVFVGVIDGVGVSQSRYLLLYLLGLVFLCWLE